jgi:hypothetical protein
LIGALPAVTQATVPDGVRAGGPQAVAGFKAALAFERELLTKLLAEALPESEGEEPRATEMPETFADAIVAAGGAGLAGGLYGTPGASR